MDPYDIVHVAVDEVFKTIEAALKSLPECSIFLKLIEVLPAAM